MIPPDIALFVKDFDEEEKVYWEAAIGFDLPVPSIDFGFDLDSAVENEDVDESVDWKGMFDLMDDDLMIYTGLMKLLIYFIITDLIYLLVACRCLNYDAFQK